MFTVRKLITMQEIINKFAELKPSIVVIDGEDGVGKTTKIAPLIATALNGKIFSTDNYLNKNSGGYVDFIDFEKLKREILEVEKNKPIVLEGLMMLLILERLEMFADYYIYAGSNVWVDEWLREGGNYTKTFAEVVLKEEEKVNFVNKAINSALKWKMSGLRKEIYQYTYESNPFKKSHSILRM